MKIAIINRELKTSGGGERQLLHLALELQRRGEDVTLYTIEADPRRCFPDLMSGLRVVTARNLGTNGRRIPRLPIFGTFLFERREEILARSLAALIEKDTELLNPHEQWALRVVAAFRRRGRRIPAVLMLNDLHLKSWSLFDDPLFGHPRKSVLKMPLYRFFDWLERIRRWRDLDAIVVLNIRTQAMVRRFMKKESFVVRSGVDLDRFSYRPHSAPKREGPVKLFCHGIFYEHRRFEDVIEAVAALRRDGIDARLTITGGWDGRDIWRAYHERLERLVAARGLGDAVSFEGIVSDARLAELYDSSDIFVSASHLQTWGLAVFEALATGLPVILSETTGAAEVLQNGAHALFCTPGKPETIVLAARPLLREPALYERLSRDGNAFVRSRITWERYANEMLGIFQKAKKSRDKSA